MAASAVMPRGVNQPGLSDFNQRVVLDAIRLAGSAGTSRTELAESTGLAPQTITNVVRRLMVAELVREAGQVSRGPGKPRRIVKFNPNGAFAVGIHIDPSVVDVILMDLTGEIRSRAERDIQDGEPPATTLSAVAHEVNQIIDNSHISPDRVVGVGVAAPGPIRLSTRMIVNPPYMPLWRDVPVGEQLETLTGRPVLLMKDVAAGARGELWLRRFGEAASFVFCYLGTGLGISAVVAGTVQMGVDGNAGEVGPRLTSPDADIVANDAEDHVGVVTAPATWVRRAVALDLLPSVPIGPLHPRRVAHAVNELVTKARTGNSKARGLFRRVGEVLGHALAGYSDIFDIPEVVLGGPYWERVADLVLPHVSASLNRDAVLSSVRPLHVDSCAHGRDVSAVGAASEALRSFPLLAGSEVGSWHSLAAPELTLS